MPHIVLETTSDLLENDRIPDLLEALVHELCLHDTVTPSAVKAYHGLRMNWHMGPGAPRGFAHCEVRLLGGRPVELRRAIADAMDARLRGLLAESLAEGVAGVTLEVREMDPETYRK